MSDNDFIILDIAGDFGPLRVGRSPENHPGGGPFETLSTKEILVARPRGIPVFDYISIDTTNDRRAAQDASRDPRKIVARSMPVTLIEPVGDEGFVASDSDPVTASKAAGASWGVADVLGASPREIDGAGVKVAILDTGIDANHPAFVRIQHNILSTRQNFSDGHDDDINGHGTHCAGTIFGNDVDGVRMGVARGISDVLIGKVIGDDGFGSTKAVLDALKWAHSNGANVISMSLGFDFPKMQKNLMAKGHPPELATSIALKAYRDNLRQFETLASLLMQESEDSPGTVLVAAAGNESRRKQSPDFVIDVTIPAAAARGIISVGATQTSENGRLQVAPFSNINPQVSAPGVAIVSAAIAGGLRADSGTSMACPHVAGVAALWWAWINERNHGQVRATDVAAQLTATARDRVFEANVTFSDRGAGAVMAPQR
ncbi:S8 family serine peptidase [Bosea sp. BIWAKO-01]|uniref:S8 family peptidase n=1 Tax=Bosea sp. BIWAKO-01 TaxID=506668 RepID=UPI00086C5747|nr:S8 family serine peptidase [Bosea sp. BIWAKO-01]GAU82940.1 subtilisin [Bosea sp. BIWAKO-01]